MLIKMKESEPEGLEDYLLVKRYLKAKMKHYNDELLKIEKKINSLKGGQNMKTEGLTFLEAIQALKDGKCKMIENSSQCQYFINDIGIVNYTVGDGVQLSPSSFLDDWKLVGVKQKVVIENVKWGSRGAIYPKDMENNYHWEDLLGKPKMKMTLEWED